MGGRQFVQLCKNRCFQFRQLWHRFNDHVGSFNRLRHVVEWLKVGGPFGFLLSRGFPSCNAFVPERVDSIHSTLKAVWKGIEQTGGPSGLGANLSNACTHGSSADDGNGGDVHGTSKEGLFMMIARRLSGVVVPPQHLPQ